MRLDSFARARRLGSGSFSWWGIMLFGGLSAVVVPLLVLVLGFIIELFDSRGEVDVLAVDLAEVQTWAGKPPAERNADQSIPYRNAGLMPLVYRHEVDSFAGGMLRDIYQAVPFVRSTWYGLLGLAVIALALAALESITLVMLYRAGRSTAIDVSTRLQNDIMDQAFRLGASDFLRGGTDRVRNLLGRDIPALEGGLAQWWRTVPRAFALLAMLVLLALLVNPWVTLATLLFAAMTWLLFGWLKKRAVARAALWSDRVRLQRAMLLEKIQQVLLVTSFSLPEAPGESFTDTLKQQKNAAKKAVLSETLVGPIINLFVFAGVGLAVFLIGTNILAAEPRMTIAGMTVLGTALLCAYFPLRRITRLRDTLPDIERSAENIYAFIDREAGVVETPGAIEAGPVKQTITFERVTLAGRSGKKILDGLDASIPVGKRVVLVASDRDLPMAVAGLLPRFYEPAAGRIRIDGTDLHRFTLRSLRDRVILVPRDGTLFTGTVADNIACADAKLHADAKNHADARHNTLQITDAAKIARCYNFIQQLPQGFATVIGEHGMRLEPGQAFRLGLARAALRDPSVIIVQEPDGELSDEAAGHVNDALRQLSQGRTLLLLPARVETLRNADHILFLHQGKLFAEGTHANLLQQNELYRHLVYIRFNPLRDQVN